MHLELAAEGRLDDVAFVGINEVSGLDFADRFDNIVTFPMFQDTAEVDARGQHGGAREDVYVYLPDGTLYAYLRGRTGEYDLGTDAGYAAVKALILDAAAAGRAR